MRVNMSTISIILLHFLVNNYFIYIASVSSVFLLGFETVFPPMYLHYSCIRIVLRVTSFSVLSILIAPLAFSNVNLKLIPFIKQSSLYIKG